MKKIVAFILVSLLYFSCEKKNESCWQVYDMLGNPMGIVCDKTETEIQALYGPFYDRADAPKFCWKVSYSNGTINYVEDMSEKMAAYWFRAANNWEKWACGYCQRWSGRQKRILKSTGSYSYTPMVVQQYCGDTCSTIYAGRTIVLRETPDSIIYHEFLQRF